MDAGGGALRDFLHPHAIKDTPALRAWLSSLGGVTAVTLDGDGGGQVEFAGHLDGGPSVNAALGLQLKRSGGEYEPAPESTPYSQRRFVACTARLERYEER